MGKFRKVLADSWDFKISNERSYPIAVAKAAKHFDIPLNLTNKSTIFCIKLLNVCIKHIPRYDYLKLNLIREIEKAINLEDRWNLF